MRKHGNSREKGTNCANGNLEIGGAEATLVARILDSQSEEYRRMGRAREEGLRKVRYKP